MRNTASPAARVIKRDQLNFQPATAVADGGAVVHAAPIVQLVRDGNAVRSIHIDCMCGRTMDIAVHVDPAATPSIQPTPEVRP
jgi:hypothetical protein